MGGKASGIERARRAYMKQSAREIILKMHYFYEAEEELEAEWKEFNAGAGGKRNAALHASKQFIYTIRTRRVAVSTYSERGCSNGTESTQTDRPAGHKRSPAALAAAGNTFALGQLWESEQGLAAPLFLAVVRPKQGRCR